MIKCNAFVKNIYLVFWITILDLQNLLENSTSTWLFQMSTAFLFSLFLLSRKTHIFKFILDTVLFSLLLFTWWTVFFYLYLNFGTNSCIFLKYTSNFSWKVVKFCGKSFYEYTVHIQHGLKYKYLDKTIRTVLPNP